MTERRRLTTEPNIADADAFYEALLAAHKGLDAQASAAFDARLTLVLANHVGDMEVLREALALAMRAARD